MPAEHLPLPPSCPTPRNTPSDSDNPPSSYAKASLHSQARPVSTTTTATHSTITPLPSDALRNRMNHRRNAYIHRPHSTDTHTSLQDHDQSSLSCECDSDDLPSETPSTSTRKLPLPSFFGISLTRRSSLSISPSPSERKADPSASESRTKSSRKRSFRFTSSRPSTPKSVDESSKPSYSIPVPSSPLPLSASPRRRSFGLAPSQRNTPKSSTGHLPLPQVPSTPSPRPHGRRHSVASERPPHDSAVALPEQSSHPSLHKSTHVPPDGGGRNKGKEREAPLSDSETLLPDPRPSVNFIPPSLPADPSPITRLYPPSKLVVDSAFPSHLPATDSALDNKDPSFLALPSVPRIIHTPPTPQRPGEVDSPSWPPIDLPHADPRKKLDVVKPKTVTIAHKEQIIVLSPSSSSSDGQRSPKGRFTPRFFAAKGSSKLKDSNLQKSNGRPTAAGSTPASPARSMTNHRSKLGSFDFESPVSAPNGSHFTPDREPSRFLKDGASSSYAKSSLHSLERTISNDSARGGDSRFIVFHPGQAESSVLSQSKPDHSADASVLSFSSISLQTRSTGKGTGSSTPAGHSSSWGRVSGRHILRSSHGTFAFESAPSSPNPPTFNLASAPNQTHLAGHVSADARGKHSRAQSYNTNTPSDNIDPSLPKPTERALKGKGRSLDLGLGLSWAPSRLREEVLIPGPMLSREKAKQKKGKIDGPDVTKVFESLLSESRFQSFKKYVHRFDAHIIPLDGPCGLLARVEKLLADTGLGERERNNLMSEFTLFVESHGG